MSNQPFGYFGPGETLCTPVSAPSSGFDMEDELADFAQEFLLNDDGDEDRYSPQSTLARSTYSEPGSKSAFKVEEPRLLPQSSFGRLDVAKKPVKGVYAKASKASRERKKRRRDELEKHNEALESRIEALRTEMISLETEVKILQDSKSYAVDRQFHEKIKNKMLKAEVERHRNFVENCLRQSMKFMEATRQTDRLMRLADFADTRYQDLLGCIPTIANATDIFYQGDVMFDVLGGVNPIETKMILLPQGCQPSEATHLLGELVVRNLPVSMSTIKRLVSNNHREDLEKTMRNMADSGWGHQDVLAKYKLEVEHMFKESSSLSNEPSVRIVKLDKREDVHLKDEDLSSVEIPLLEFTRDDVVLLDPQSNQNTGTKAFVKISSAVGSRHETYLGFRNRHKLSSFAHCNVITANKEDPDTVDIRFVMRMDLHDSKKTINSRIFGNPITRPPFKHEKAAGALIQTVLQNAKNLLTSG